MSSSAWCCRPPVTAGAATHSCVEQYASVAIDLGGAPSLACQVYSNEVQEHGPGGNAGNALLHAIDASYTVAAHCSSCNGVFARSFRRNEARIQLAHCLY